MKTYLGIRHAHPIPYFIIDLTTDRLHISRACHEQGGNHDPS